MPTARDNGGDLLASVHELVQRAQPQPPHTWASPTNCAAPARARPPSPSSWAADAPAHFYRKHPEMEAHRLYLVIYAGLVALFICLLLTRDSVFNFWAVRCARAPGACGFDVPRELAAPGRELLGRGGVIGCCLGAPRMCAVGVINRAVRQAVATECQLCLSARPLAQPAPPAAPPPPAARPRACTTSCSGACCPPPSCSSCAPQSATCSTPLRATRCGQERAAARGAAKAERRPFCGRPAGSPPQAAPSAGGDAVPAPNSEHPPLHRWRAPRLHLPPGPRCQSPTPPPPPSSISPPPNPTRIPSTRPSLTPST
jgi:hypothetical protein